MEAGTAAARSTGSKTIADLMARREGLSGAEAAAEAEAVTE